MKHLFIKLISLISLFIGGLFFFVKANNNSFTVHLATCSNCQRPVYYNPIIFDQDVFREAESAELLNEIRRWGKAEIARLSLCKKL